MELFLIRFFQYLQKWIANFPVTFLLSRREYPSFIDIENKNLWD